MILLSPRHIRDERTIIRMFSLVFFRSHLNIHFKGSHNRKSYDNKEEEEEDGDDDETERSQYK